MSGRNIHEKVFESLNEIERRKLGKKIDKELIPEIIFTTFPDNDILNEQQAISHLEKKTGLDQNVIAHSINELISQKKLITAFDTKNRLHLRKNRFN
jgi:hypothetical protein